MSDEGTLAQWSATFGPIPQISEIDRIRMQFWEKAFWKVIWPSEDLAGACHHADKCLAEFDSRFNKKEAAE